MTENTIARRLASAASGSWLVQVCLRMIASMQARPDAIPPHVIDGDLSALRSLFLGSALASPMRERARRTVASVSGSQALRALTAWHNRFRSVERWQSIRAVGMAGLIAVLVDLVLTVADPRPASVYRWFMWAAAAFISGVLAIGARSFDAARQESRVLRRF